MTPEQIVISSRLTELNKEQQQIGNSLASIDGQLQQLQAQRQQMLGMFNQCAGAIREFEFLLNALGKPIQGAEVKVDADKLAEPEQNSVG